MDSESIFYVMTESNEKSWYCFFFKHDVHFSVKFKPDAQMSFRHKMARLIFKRVPGQEGVRPLETCLHTNSHTQTHIYSLFLLREQDNENR